VLCAEPSTHPIGSIKVSVLSRVSDDWIYEAGVDSPAYALTLPSESTNATQLVQPSLLASGDRETFILTTGVAAEWRSFKALPVLNNVVATEITSSAVKVQYTRAASTHLPSFASSIFISTLARSGSLYNGSSLAQALLSTSAVNMLLLLCQFWRLSRGTRRTTSRHIQQHLLLVFTPRPLVARTLCWALHYAWLLLSVELLVLWLQQMSF